MRLESLSLSLRTLLVFSIFLIFSDAKVYAQNGAFGAPTKESFLSLSPEEHDLFQSRFGRLNDPDFLKTDRYQSASFHATAQGKQELIQLAGPLLELSKTHARIVFIGRSPAAIHAFLVGMSLSADSGNVELSDIPFSWRNKSRPSPEQVEGLREHLKANRLDPISIAFSNQPILFVDAVYSGTGAHRLLEEIMIWAKQLAKENQNFKDLPAKVKDKMNFLGYFPAAGIARESLNSEARSSAKELMKPYQAPTDQEVSQRAKDMTLPMLKSYQEVSGKVYSIKISESLYAYGSVFAVNVQQSFTPDLWTTRVDRSKINSFKGMHQNDAYLEAYYLIFLGRQMAEMTKCALGLFQVSSHEATPINTFSPGAPVGGAKSWRYP